MPAKLLEDLVLDLNTAPYHFFLVFLATKIRHIAMRVQKRDSEQGSISLTADDLHKVHKVVRKRIRQKLDTFAS